MTRTRIAPSPTGFPHIGTIFQALINFVLAKQDNGKFLVRIEDTDQSRKVDGAEEQIFKYLKYYGLEPDESIMHGGDFGPYRQSERLDIYKKYALQLIEDNHAYYCFCSKDRLDNVRKEMQKLGKPPMYDKHCRHLDKKTSKSKAESQACVIRMMVPENKTIIIKDELRGDIAFESVVVDDQVIIKSDGFPTYHLAVVVDDHLMKISHTVRGEEWISSAPKHKLLYDYLGWDAPKFIHTPLLRNLDKSKLSKRHGHTSAKWYKDEGYLVEAVINFLASRVWNHPQGKEIYSLQEIIKHFSTKNMHVQGPIVDLDKLNWINGQWIRAMSNDDLIVRLRDFASKELPIDLLEKILPLIKDRLVKLSNITELTEYFYQKPIIENEIVLKQSKMSNEKTAEYLKKVLDTIQACNMFEAAELETALRKLQIECQLKPKPAFMTIRIILTGKKYTPPLFDVMEIIGKEEVINRLGQAINSLI